MLIICISGNIGKFNFNETLGLKSCIDSAVRYFFLLQSNPRNLDFSCKMDLVFGGRFIGQKKQKKKQTVI